MFLQAKIILKSLLQMDPQSDVVVASVSQKPTGPDATLPNEVKPSSLSAQRRLHFCDMLCDTHGGSWVGYSSRQLTPPS